MGFNRSIVNVIGCGFAGIECALFLAGHGIKVHIFDSDNNKNQDILTDYCECQRKRKLNEEILKNELKFLGSPLIKSQEIILNKGYNKDQICQLLLKIGKYMVKNNENISYFKANIHEINPNEITIIATGLNTDESMVNYLMNNLGSMRCFTNMPIYPVFQNINENLLYLGSEQDYLYLPLTFEDYNNFVDKINKLINQQAYYNKIDFIDNTLEDLAKKGKDCLKNYAMRPVLLDNLQWKPYAVIKFKKVDAGLMLEGVCSNLRLIDQLEIFHSLKEIKSAIMVRKAEIRKACFLNGKYVVNKFCQSLFNENLFFAGSILGISGYIDCIASGLYVGMSVNKFFKDQLMVSLPKDTCFGQFIEKIISSTSTKAHPFINDFDVINNLEGDDKELIEKFFNISIEKLAKFKEDYIYGKHV